MTEQTNQERAERAYRTLLQGAYTEGGAASIEEAITDLTVDLLHLADEYADDTEQLHARAWRHYAAEKYEEDRAQAEREPEPGEYGYEEPALHENEEA